MNASERWPTLFTRLDERQTRAVDQTVAAEGLEGWEPRPDQIADLVAVLLRELTVGSYLVNCRAEADTFRVAVPPRRRLFVRRHPYLVPGTRVLRNNFDYRDGAALRSIEFTATAVRILQVHDRRPDVGSGFDATHLCELHQHVFGDVFAWAGQTRIVDITKGGNEFAPVPAIEDYLGLVAGYVADADWSTPDRGALAFTLARIYATLNHAHPFREGNGRTATLFLHQLAAQTPFRLDLSAVSVRDWTDGSRDSAPFRRSGEPSPRPLIPIFHRALVADSLAPSDAAVADVPIHHPDDQAE